MLGNVPFGSLPALSLIVFNIKNGWTIILVAFITSTCVEVTQFILSVGVADIDDIILNTTGAGMGIVFFMLLKKWLPDLYEFFDGRSGLVAR